MVREYSSTKYATRGSPSISIIHVTSNFPAYIPTLLYILQKFVLISSFGFREMTVAYI